MKKPTIVTFKNRDKEARFWEKNYRATWKAGKPVDIRFAKNLSESINIRLDSPTLHDVRGRAKEKGLGPTQLIRMWIMERLENEGNRFRSASM
ncbi:hypothetical protein HY032_03205 [Candidatus Gottesmanbacteria bacterium]|nr:hypothetical protein [Candidatus Gottesmanbacteria bacterium]